MGLHGNLQRIAFLVLFPIGGAIALMRHKIGDGWLKYHVFFQLTATLVVFTAIGVQLVKWKRKRKENTPKQPMSPILMTHIVIGSIVSFLLVSQILWAYIGRKIAPWDVWYYTHMTMAVLIVGGGIANLVVGTVLAHG